ncbi:MAG TPA: hypothetical protein GXX15_12340, partial [Clostridia bacterium]|nr:hypothetical protein [Clostridia bacterium]
MADKNKKIKEDDIAKKDMVNCVQFLKREMIQVSLQRPTEFNAEEIKLTLLFDNTQKMGYSKKFLECE